jgi:hypothetical protein
MRPVTGLGDRPLEVCCGGGGGAYNFNTYGVVLWRGGDEDMRGSVGVRQLGRGALHGGRQ